MYKIIGADRREYGPVSADQIRQWLAEGRVDVRTLVRPEAGTEWKALINFPELQPPAIPPPLVPPVQNYVVAPKPPGADKKIAAGICGILLGSRGVHKFILGYSSEGAAMLLVTLLTCGIGGMVMHVIGLVEGIIYLTKSDADFSATYIVNKKGWF